MTSMEVGWHAPAGPHEALALAVQHGGNRINGNYVELYDEYTAQSGVLVGRESPVVTGIESGGGLGRGRFARASLFLPESELLHQLVESGS